MKHKVDTAKKERQSMEKESSARLMRRKMPVHQSKTNKVRKGRRNKTKAMHKHKHDTKCKKSNFTTLTNNTGLN